MIAPASFDHAGFIRANTAIMAPPHVPEIMLHLADEAHDLWTRTQEELGAMGIEPPFWAFAWAGGQGLARYILDNPAVVSGRSVLDFASGSGLVAIAAAQSGASHVVANDVDPMCAHACALNAAINATALDVRISDMIGDALADTDVVLAGDVFYDRVMAARVTEWFVALARSGKTVLVGDPGRSYLPREAMTLLGAYQVAVTRALEDAEVKHTCVWRFDP